MMDIGYAGAVVGGVLTLLSPCSVMLLPAFFAYAFTSPTKLIARTGVFYLGLALTLVPLGGLAGSLGALLMQNRSTLVVVASLVLIVLGLVQVAGIRLPALSRGGGADGTSVLSVFLLGCVYGVAGVCAGPILGSVLTVAAVGGNPIYGSILLALFALGMTVPLFVLALVWDRFGIARRAWLKPKMLTIGRWSNSWLMVVAGLLAIGIGVLLWVTDGTAGIDGILTVGTQAALESSAMSASAGVSNLAFAGIAVGVIAAVAIAYAVISRRRSRRSA